MNKKFVNITLLSLLFCTVNNSNGGESGSNLEESLELLSESGSTPYHVEIEPFSPNKLNHDLRNALLIKIVTKTGKEIIEKSDYKPLALVFDIADEVADINSGLKWINGSSFGAEKIPGKLKYDGDATNKKTLIASLIVVGGGRLLGDKTPLGIVGKKYDEFFKNFWDGRLESVGDLGKKAFKSICVNGTLIVFDSLMPSTSSSKN